MVQTKEERKAYDQSPAGKKRTRKSKWKRRGIRVADNEWDCFYQYFLSITHCQICEKKLTVDKQTTHSTRCVDHDHNINDRENVRAICCHACNINDQSTNTSGEPNIYYNKTRDCWNFRKIIQGKEYSKSGFKTKEEACAYKKSFISVNL